MSKSIEFGGNGEYEIIDDEAGVFTIRHVPSGQEITVDSSGTFSVLPGTVQPGTATDPAIEIGNSGAGFFVDSNGEVNVVDEAGNSTIIS